MWRGSKLHGKKQQKKIGNHTQKATSTKEPEPEVVAKKEPEAEEKDTSEDDIEDVPFPEVSTTTESDDEASSDSEPVSEKSWTHGRFWNVSSIQLNELWLYIGFYSTELYLESGSEVIYLLELVFQSPWVVQLLSEDWTYLTVVSSGKVIIWLILVWNKQ